MHTETITTSAQLYARVAWEDRRKAVKRIAKAHGLTEAQADALTPNGLERTSIDGRSIPSVPWRLNARTHRSLNQKGLIENGSFLTADGIAIAEELARAAFDLTLDEYFDVSAAIVKADRERMRDREERQAQLRRAIGEAIADATGVTVEVNPGRLGDNVIVKAEVLAKALGIDTDNLDGEGR